MLAFAVVGALLADATDGRSWGGALAFAGITAIVDCVVYLRRPSVAAPKRPEHVHHPLSAVAGIAAGLALLVIGVLGATELIAL